MSFHFTFEPDMEGEYTITATFEGSKSYYRSESTTYLSVDSVQPEVNGALNYTMLLCGVIVTVIVVALLVVYTLYTVKQQR